MSITRPVGPKEPATEVDFAAAVLLLCAHGSGAGAPEAHAARIRGRGLFRGVASCSLNGKPSLSDRLASIDAERVYLAPLLMADGHTYNAVLPQLLAQVDNAGGRVLCCPPLGVSPDLGAIAAARAMALCAGRRWPPDKTSLVIAAHGTQRHGGSAKSAARLATRIGAMRRFRQVHAAYLEQSPELGATLGSIQPDPCVVLGFFMDNGGHSLEDVPGTIAAAHPGAAYTGAIGARPEIADIVLNLVRATARREDRCRDAPQREILRRAAHMSAATSSA